MSRKYLELIKNTGILAVASFSSKILVFLLVPLYTSVLSTEDYGLADLVVATIQLVVPIFTVNIADSVLRFSLENQNINGVLSVAVKYTLLSVLPALAMLIVVSFTSYDTSRIYWPFILLYYIFYSLNQVFPAYAKGIDNVKEMAIAGVIGTVVTVASCIISLVGLKTGINGYFVSIMLGQMLPVIYLFFKLDLFGRIREYRIRDKELEHRMLLYSAPLIMTTIGWWINNTSDRYIITYFYDIGFNGLLSIAYKIPSILSVLSGLFIQAWQISAMKEYNQVGGKEFYRIVFVYLNIFLYFMTFALILFTRPLAHIAFQKDFYEAWIFVPFLLLSSMFTANAGFLSPIITSSYNTKDVALSTVYGAIINVILNITLLQIIGSQGVAIATAISGFVIFMYRYHVLNGLFPQKIFMRCLLLWIFLVVQCVMEMYSLTYFELPLALLIIWLFRKEIKEICQKAVAFIKGITNKQLD